MSAGASGLEAHRAAAETVGSIALAVVTVSDTRTEETDGSGHWLLQAIAEAGHRVVHRVIVPDAPEDIAQAMDDALASGARVVVLTGGTGIAPRDGTPEVVRAKLSKELPGFGELFRMLSFEEIGAAALLSRALAGVSDGRLLVSLPGSRAAVQLAWERLLEPELEHIIAQLDGRGTE